jgi:hypothetical protein
MTQENLTRQTFVKQEFDASVGSIIGCCPGHEIVIYFSSALQASSSPGADSHIDA